MTTSPEDVKKNYAAATAREHAKRKADQEKRAAEQKAQRAKEAAKKK